MKFIVPGPNIKVLGRAIHSLAKLGNELYIESTHNSLSFRTANLSKTAYASFQFSSNFFSYFGSGKDASSAHSLKCQISMRSSLVVFRSPMLLDRTVESLQIQQNPNCDKLIFLMKYKKGYSKTYNIPVIECETLKAYYLKNKAANKLLVQPKVVNEMLSNFQNSQYEITWKVTKNELIVRNYSENDLAYSGVRTELKVGRNEFDEFKIENETEITFCLKELRAVLFFSDNVGLPLTVHFTSSSRPIIFALKSDVFKADIVVSTLVGPDYVDSQANKSRVGERAERDVEQNIEEEELIHNQNDEFLCNMELDEEKLLLQVQNSQKQSIQRRETDSVKKKKEKLNHVFQKFLSNEKFDVTKLPGYDVILAPDSGSGSD